MKKTVVITGARGLVARYIIDQLSNKSNYLIYAVSGHKEIIEQRYNELDNVICVDNQELQTRYLTILPNSIVIHCAFTRTNDGLEVAKSMDWSYLVFTMAKEAHAHRVINMSTRSVYKEPAEGELNTEESSINAGSPISAGKYGVELMLKAIFKNSNTEFVNLRLASVNELKEDDTMIRPLNVFVKNVIEGKDIKIVGGMQTMSYIDPRDIAEATIMLIESDSLEWDTYNLGTGWLCTDTLLNIANRVLEVGKELGYDQTNLIVEVKSIEQRAGLDISKLTSEIDWTPRISLDIMIKDLFTMLQK